MHAVCSRKTLLALWMLTLWAHAQNTTMTSFEEESDEDAANLEELELELLQQYQQPERRGAGRGSGPGWSPWSSWSPCSRSCDGGASFQLRRCESPSGCGGDDVRHKICNMQPCPEAVDFRLQQCSAFNEVPYEGQLLTWTPHHEDSEPCALTCRGRPRVRLAASAPGPAVAAAVAAPLAAPAQADAPDPAPGPRLVEAPPLPPEEEAAAARGLAPDDVDEPSIVVRLAPKVQDGTRCRPGSLDMCINGKCQRVGCDLRIGSLKKVDACGVCGGDGSSCARPLYRWTEAPLSLCSASCGGGRRMLRPVCRNALSDAEVDDQLCNASSKPGNRMDTCNTHPCPPRWVAEEWGPCSVSCGGGQRFRYVHCTEDGNGTRTKVAEQLCHGHRPHYQEPCNVMECPTWDVGEWSACSVTCGDGVQTRNVTCKDPRDRPSLLCDPTTRPPTSQQCRSGAACARFRSSFYDWDGEQTEQMPGVTQPLVQPYPPPGAALYGGATAERLVGEQVVPSEATFIAEKWSPCSVTCGQGVRTRAVNCKIFLEFSRTVAKLPDHQCQGPKPAQSEPCEMEPCPIINDAQSMQGIEGIKVSSVVKGTTYSWKEMGFTHCSASCLGGVQESLITCVRDSDGKAVMPYLCEKETRPELLIRTCNDHPCPPRWNFSDFQTCTKSCGIGIQTREVTCIHEVTRSNSNTLIVPSNMCPQPPPPDRQYCNVLDCPERWHTSEWSKCSKPCGGGIKTRSVECKQVMAQNHIVPRPAAKCTGPKPHDKKPCNTKSCQLDNDRPIIAISNTTYKQQKPNRKRVTLKIGGRAVIYAGTQVKIKCPVKKFNRTKIQWTKNDSFIVNNKKYRISKKGALKIQDIESQDAGKYSCIAGLSKADLLLSVKDKLGVLTSSEEIERQQSPKVPERHDDPNMENIASGQSSFLQPSDDFSHEHRPLEVNPGKKPIRNQQVGNHLGETSRVHQAASATHQPPSQRNQEVNLYQVENWPHSSTTHVSDQEQEPSNMPAPGTIGPQYDGSVSESLPPRFHDPSEGPPSSSAGTRPMPHFQQLLANLQSFSNSRGHRMVSDPVEEDQHWDDVDHNDEKNIEEGKDDDQEVSEDGLFGPAVVLGRGSPENLKFTWMISNWSDCSQTCGGSGFQMRAAHCMVQLHNNSQNVDSNLCEDAGLPPPPTIQKCGMDECPRWVSGAWSSCEDSRCFTWNTAMQRRDISCELPNGTLVDLQLCSEVEKPPQRQECYNDKCKGTWKVGEWSECAAPCEQPGIKYRILQCVWYGTKKPAGNACRDQTRPLVMKVCKGPPCVQLSECKDQSKYCHNVKVMNMCRVRRYQHQCCHSCRNKG